MSLAPLLHHPSGGRYESSAPGERSPGGYGWAGGGFGRPDQANQLLLLVIVKEAKDKVKSSSFFLRLARMTTTNGFEAFTRLTPAPDVQIDRAKFSTVTRLLALRVPKVSTLRLPFFWQPPRPNTTKSSLLPRRSPAFRCRHESLTGPIVHRVAGQVPAVDEGAEGTGAGPAAAPLRHERPRGASCENNCILHFVVGGEKNKRTSSIK